MSRIGLGCVTFGREIERELELLENLPRLRAGLARPEAYAEDEP